MGRACGRPRLSPSCNLRSRNPASTRASALKGGVFTSPFNQTSGLFSVRAMISYVQYDINERAMMIPGHYGVRTVLGHTVFIATRDVVALLQRFSQRDLQRSGLFPKDKWSSGSGSGQRSCARVLAAARLSFRRCFGNAGQDYGCTVGKFSHERELSAHHPGRSCAGWKAGYRYASQEGTRCPG